MQASAGQPIGIMWHPLHPLQEGPLGMPEETWQKDRVVFASTELPIIATYSKVGCTCNKLLRFLAHIVAMNKF
jgi:hypothetical protein